MQGKTRWAMKVQKDDGQLEQLVDRARRLHDQEVFDLFAWIVCILVRSARQYFGNDRVNKGKRNYSERLFLKHTSKIPA